MAKLFVEKSIEIHARASVVWWVLTDPHLNRHWIKEWWPDILEVDSDWKVGSHVLWKITGDRIGADGMVLTIEPLKSLRFTFSAKGGSASGEQASSPHAHKQEEISYTLEEGDGHTTLSVSVGDFGDTPEHEACYAGAVEAWNVSLPKIKEIAEQ